MYLSKLEIFGFKSFADRTEFTLKPGLTGIVGPNGCGKSNVVDAIKWVLGEQSAKSLRGSEMLDVIFNGAGTRKPLGLAEVTLTFSEVRDVLRVEQEEISITRRLFRSGESEYLLNKQPCRLKDIREMLMDTGIGKEAYSVIEQGKIDTLLQANAQDRRAIFEEAAGISRYKAKRKETERRLDRIDGNLQRLCDIIEEVEKQIRSVKAQAGRARRYGELLQEWKEKRLTIAGAQRRQIRADAERIAERLRVLREEEAVASARLSTLEADLSTADEELSRLEDGLLQVRGDLARVDSRISSEQQRSRMEREKGVRLTEESERLAGEARQHRVRIQEIIGELREKRKGLREAEEEVGRVETAIRTDAARKDELQQREQTIREEEEERKTRLLDALNSRAHAQNRQVSLEANLVAILQRLGRKESEADRLADERAEVARRRAQEAAGRCVALDEVVRRRAFLAAQGEYRQRLDSIQGRRGDELAGLERRRTAVASSLEVLRGIRSQMEGVQEGTKSLLSVNQNEGFPGLGKMLADCIDVDLRYASALEAALGSRAQAILAEATCSAVQAIRFLKEEEKGRASILPMDHPGRNGTRPPLQGPGLIGLASSLVRAPESLESTVEVLLGHTWVVQDLECAVRYSRNGGTGETFVTLDGDVVDPQGFICGGRGEKSGGLILNRSRLRSLEDEGERLDLEIGSIRSLRDKTADRLETVQGRIAREESAIAEGEGVASDAGAEIRRLDQSLGHLEERLAVDRLEAEDLRRQRETTEREQAAASEEVARTNAEALSLEEETRRAAQIGEEVRRDREALGAELTRLRVAEARVREKLDALRGSMANLVRGLRERRESLHGTRRGSSEAGWQAREAESAARNAEENLRGLVEKSESLRAQEVRLQEGREEKAEGIQTLREESRLAGGEVERAKDEIQNARLDENQTTLRQESLTTRAREELGVDLAELPEPSEGWDEEEATSRIAEVKQKLDRMGNVNLEALDQLAELEERYAFLKAQKDDLDRAKRSLQEAIRRIARTCRERFSETFDAVRDQFQEVFRKLFGGGRADIFLQESEDDLEAGVEIVARPPGKEPRQISLLSGGEKTLTTIALLFAIFKSRPSPFCILDEVDAALDESNINRFVLMLREFLSHSQFLIITHSKPTMAVADVLYGVTQEEQGVTKRIHVRFEEIERQVA